MISCEGKSASSIQNESRKFNRAFRSTGYGSLQVWIRYLRTGITFEDQYRPSYHCHRSTWSGPAFTIGGGYNWEDVYPEAASRNVVVVGGGTPVRSIISNQRNCANLIFFTVRWMSRRLDARRWP